MGALVHVLRSLRQAPGFTAAVVVTLALGIGANTAIYSLFDATVLHPLPVRDPARLYEVEMAWSNPDYGDFAVRNHSFSPLAAFATRDELRLGRGEQTEMLPGSFVSANFFAALGVQPAAGRLLGSADRGQPVAVIGHDLWQRIFGGRTNVAGWQLTVNGQPVAVAGVAPRGFRGTSLSSNPQLWLPLEMAPQLFPGPMADLQLRGRDFTWLRLVGRLAPRASQRLAEEDLSAINRQLKLEYPQVFRDKSVRLSSVTSTALGIDSERSLMRFIGALGAMVGFVLLVACATVANLLLARAMSHRKEFAVRLALGAGRGHIIRQLVLESLVLAGAGGLAGLLVARAIVRLLGAFELPGRIVIGTLGLGLNWRMLGCSLALAAVAGLVFGLSPIREVSRPNLIATLREQVAGQGHTSARLRSAFVVVQLAFSLVLLIGGGLFVRSLRHALAADLGFDPDRVALATVDLSLLDYPLARAEAFYRQALERVLLLPGVESAAWANLVPLRRSRVEDIKVEGFTPTAGKDTSVLVNYVTPAYFRTLGLPVRRGRDFSAADQAGAPLVAIANRTMAEHYWPGMQGGRLSIDGGKSWIEVVGVAADSRYRALGEPPTTYLYLPLAQHMKAVESDAMSLLVRGRDPARLVPAVRRELAALDANAPVLRLATLREHLNGVLLPQRMGATLLGGFSLVAVALAAAGIYGLLSYLVSLRSHEIGVRMALGASRRKIVALVVGSSLVPVALGIALGLLIAFWTTRLIADFLFGVGVADPATFVLTAAGLAVVALVACSAPALRASRVRPARALRDV
jgi:predicted permease